MGECPAGTGAEGSRGPGQEEAGKLDWVWVEWSLKSPAKGRTLLRATGSPSACLCVMQNAQNILDPSRFQCRARWGLDICIFIKPCYKRVVLSPSSGVRSASEKGFQVTSRGDQGPWEIVSSCGEDRRLALGDP